MKCTNKLSYLSILLILICFVTACSSPMDFEFSYYDMNGTQRIVRSDVADLFSQNLCVTNEEISVPNIEFEADESAGLFDLTQNKVLCSHRANEKMDPASMTKVMTALVALENGSLDQLLTFSKSGYITSDGAQLINLREGESMTLNQALHFLLVYSANDVAMMIAEGISGSMENFVDLMNKKAIELGATNTHFANPHGLTDEKQYTTAYDMYLIFNEAMKYEIFQQIIRIPVYTTQINQKDGKTREISVNSTDAFIREGTNVSAPSGVTVIGGKTGSTYAAGQCLIMLVRNNLGNPYIAVYMHAPDTPTLYRKMSGLLENVVEN